MNEKKIKYNYNKLRGLITEHFRTLANFAKAMNMGTTTLNSRLQSDSYFDQIEIERAVELLEIKENDVDIVFFTHI